MPECTTLHKVSLWSRLHSYLNDFAVDAATVNMQWNFKGRHYTSGKMPPNVFFFFFFLKSEIIVFCNITPLILIYYIYVMKLKYLGRASSPAPESSFSCFFSLS